MVALLWVELLQAKTVHLYQVFYVTSMMANTCIAKQNTYSMAWGKQQDKAYVETQCIN